MYSKKIRILIATVLLLALCVIVAWWYLFGSGRTEQMGPVEEAKEQSIIATTTSETTDVAEEVEYVEYRNATLGFRLEIPKGYSVYANESQAVFYPSNYDFDRGQFRGDDAEGLVMTVYTMDTQTNLAEELRSSDGYLAFRKKVSAECAHCTGGRIIALGSGSAFFENVSLSGGPEFAEEPQGVPSSALVPKSGLLAEGIQGTLLVSMSGKYLVASTQNVEIIEHGAESFTLLK